MLWSYFPLFPLSLRFSMGLMSCLSGMQPRQGCNERRFAQGASRCSLVLDSSGQGLAEYLFVVILIAIIAVLGVRYFGGSVGNQFDTAVSDLDSLSEEDSLVGLTGGGKGQGREKSVREAKARKDIRLQSEQDLGERSTADGSRTRGSTASSSADSNLVEGSRGLRSLEYERLHRAVGEVDEEAAVEEIKIGILALILIGIITLVLGIAMVFYISKHWSAGFSKKKQKKFSLLSAFHRAGNNQAGNNQLNNQGEGGQVLVMGAFFILALTMVSITVANVGMMVAEKIHLQDTVDAAAYSSATVQARYMNLSAYINRAMVSNYNAMAFNTALWATVDSHDHASAIVTSILYQISAIVEVISLGIATSVAMDIDTLADAFRDYFHRPMHELNARLHGMFSQEETDLNSYIESYNTNILSLYQGLLYAAAQSARHDVVKEVAAEMDREVITTTLLGLGAETVSYDELARAVDYVIENPSASGHVVGEYLESADEIAGSEEDDDDHPYLLGAVSEASLDKFAAGRNRSGDKDQLRQFDPVLDILDSIVRPLETALKIACKAGSFGLRRCKTYIDLDLGPAIRDGQEDQADQAHVPFLANQRMREANRWMISLRIRGIPGSSIINWALGQHGYSSAHYKSDVGNVVNSMACLNYAFDFDMERYLQSQLANESFSPPGVMPSTGLNLINIAMASLMGVVPPAICDDHWDGISDAQPVNFFEVFPPGPGQAAGAEYAADVYSNMETFEGVPNYDWNVNLEDVGFPHYYYPETGAEARPARSSRGGVITGPSLAVVGVKQRKDINGIYGLGIGNEYDMTAISRAQVYYLRNPRRGAESPSLFNPHWAARLAPINADDSPELLRRGLPYLSSMGISISPTR